MKKTKKEIRIKIINAGIEPVLNGNDAVCPMCGNDGEDQLAIEASPLHKKDKIYYADITCLVCGAVSRFERDEASVNRFIKECVDESMEAINSEFEKDEEER